MHIPNPDVEERLKPQKKLKEPEQPDSLGISTDSIKKMLQSGQLFDDYDIENEQLKDSKKNKFNLMMQDFYGWIFTKKKKNQEATKLSQLSTTST